MAVIRISGYPGAGKTTLSKKLAAELGYEYHYAGGLFRKMAAEQGLSIEAFYAKVAGSPETEQQVDTMLGALMQEKDNLIVEGRVAPFQPASFKTINVLLTVSEEEGARRELLRPENSAIALADMIAMTRERVANEKEHYFKLHGIENHFDPAKFDIVLDTTELSPEAEFETVKERLLPLLP